MEFTNFLKNLSGGWKNETKRQRTYDYEDGKEAGKLEGVQQKAIEDALILIREFDVAPQVAAQKMNAPLDKVLELQNK